MLEAAEITVKKGLNLKIGKNRCLTSVLLSDDQAIWNIFYANGCHRASSSEKAVVSFLKVVIALI